MSSFVIAKLGACSALGTEASGIQAELAAGSSAFEHRFGPHGVVTVAAFETLPVAHDRPARRRALLAHALDDLLTGMSWNAERVGIVLADSATDGLELAEMVVGRLHTLGLRPLPAAVQSHGRASWFAALQRVRELLGDDACDLVLVLASDSRCDRASIDALAHAEQLLGDDNSDGLVPGEGACVALCCRPTSPFARLPSAIRCEAVATACEPDPHHGPTPNLSRGLSQVFRELAFESSAVDIVIDCQTGPTRFTKEFHAAYLRSGALMPEPLVRNSTAASIGEAGSATAGLAMVIAQQELGRRLRALVYASDDEGQLGAAVLARVGGRTALQEQLERGRSRPLTSGFHSRPELIDDHLETCGYLQIDRLDDLISAQTPWFELVGVEARIRAHQAALALGGAATVERARVGLQSVSVDRRQGSALVAGSWLAAGELVDDVVELAAALDDDDLDELAAALALATNPGPILTALIRHSSPRLRRLGLELAPACPEVATTELVACLRNPEARGAAALCLARRNARECIAELLVAADVDPECVGVPAALVWLGHERAIERLRWLLWQRPELAEQSAGWLAMCGTLGDLQAVHERLTALQPSVAIVDALGTVGLPASLPYLLDALEREGEELRIATARALDRVTGAGLREQVLDEHGVLESQRSLTPGLWRDWLEQRSNAWPAQRVRDGQPWSLRAVWDEICGASSERSRRRLAADELALRGPVRVHLEVRGWSWVQREVLAEWGRSAAILGN